MHVVIPAYQPSAELPDLVGRLLAADSLSHVLVVNDGSGPAYDKTFDRTACAGATVLRLPENHGKGAAIKAAFRHLVGTGADGVVVTADADGQHAVDDILRVAAEVDTDPAAPLHMVLGERGFDTDTPLRSRVGNTATRALFRAATGRRLHDTQTGLRAFPASLLPWLMTQAGDRYDYELVQLLQAGRNGIDLRSVPIRTIYEDDNAGSHFRPVIDSLRIYAPLLLFLTSSFGAFLIDALMLFVLMGLTGSLLVSVVGARLISASVNFVVNRQAVFRGSDRWTTAARKYVALALTLVVANYLVLDGLVAIGVPLLVAKVITEVLLVAVSYAVQASFVYGRANDHSAPGSGRLLHHAQGPPRRADTRYDSTVMS